MSQPTLYTGTASIVLLTNVELSDKGNISIRVDPTKTPPIVSWRDSNGGSTSPPAAIAAYSLAGTYPTGYIVALKVQYLLTGYSYKDAGRRVDLVVTTTDSRGDDSFVDTIPPSYNRGLYSYWEYSTPSTYWTASQSLIPSGFDIRVQSNNISSHSIINLYWTAFYTITVINGCNDINNINSPLCTSFCLANVSTPPCPENYALKCLGNDVQAIATETCSSYYAAYIAKNVSTVEIDNQIRKYCTKYTGFDDLFETKTDPTKEAQRLKDLNLCACHLSLPTGDPDGTALYNNYYNSLIKQKTQFNSGEFQTQKKCLVPWCRDSPFRTREIPIGGCSVPKCIEIANFEVDNGGNVTSVTVNQTISGCGDTPEPPDNDLLGVITIVLIFVVIAIIILTLVVYGYSRPTRRRYVYPLVQPQSQR
jgi:hypothetical protein